MSDYDIYPLNGFELTGEYGNSEDTFIVDTLKVGNVVYILGDADVGYIPGYENVNIGAVMRVDVDTFLFKPKELHDSLPLTYINTPIYEFSKMDIEDMMEKVEVLFNKIDSVNYRY